MIKKPPPPRHRLPIIGRMESVAKGLVAKTPPPPPPWSLARCQEAAQEADAKGTLGLQIWFDPKLDVNEARRPATIIRQVMGQSDACGGRVMGGEAGGGKDGNRRKYGSRGIEQVPGSCRLEEFLSELRPLKNVKPGAKRRNLRSGLGVRMGGAV